MRLPLKTISMRFMLLIAISSLFLSPASAKDALEDQLIKASESGDFNKVIQLLGHENIDVNAKNKYGNTALILTSYKGRTRIVELLLEHEDIDVNAENMGGGTALMGASMNGRFGIANLLLAYMENKII